MNKLWSNSPQWNTALLYACLIISPRLCLHQSMFWVNINQELLWPCHVYTNETAAWISAVSLCTNLYSELFQKSFMAASGWSRLLSLSLWHATVTLLEITEPWEDHLVGHGYGEVSFWTGMCWVTIDINISRFLCWLKTLLQNICIAVTNILSWVDNKVL